MVWSELLSSYLLHDHRKATRAHGDNRRTQTSQPPPLRSLMEKNYTPIPIPDAMA